MKTDSPTTRNSQKNISFRRECTSNSSLWKQLSLVWQYVQYKFDNLIFSTIFFVMFSKTYVFFFSFCSTMVIWSDEKFRKHLRLCISEDNRKGEKLWSPLTNTIEPFTTLNLYKSFYKLIQCEINRLFQNAFKKVIVVWSRHT